MVLYEMQNPKKPHTHSYEIWRSFVFAKESKKHNFFELEFSKAVKREISVKWEFCVISTLEKYMNKKF